MILGLLCVVAAQATNVTCHVAPTSAHLAVARLGEAANMKMTARGELARDILMLEATQVPLKALMDKLAEVTFGEWSKDGDVLVLSRSGKAALMNRQRLVANDLRALQEMVRPYRETLAAAYDRSRVMKAAVIRDRIEKAQQDDTASEADSEVLAQQDLEDPVVRAFGRFVLMTNLQALAELPVSAKVTYSTAPAKDKRPFTGDPFLPLKALSKEQETWSQVHLARGGAHQWFRDESDAVLHEHAEFFDEMGFDPWSKATPFRRAIESAELTIDKLSHDNYSCKLYLKDARGKSLAVLERSLYTPDPWAPSDAEPTDWVDLEPASRQLIERSKDRFVAGSRVPLLRGAIEPWIKDPVEHDPLSLVLTEALRGYASKKQVSIVANLPDSLSSSIFTTNDDFQVSPSALLRNLREWDNASVTETEGWLTIAPADLRRATDRQMDRAKLKSLLAGVLARGEPTFEDLANYSETVPEIADGDVDLSYLVRLYSGGLLDVFDANGWLLLRFLSGLTPSQRDTFYAGRAIPLSSMSAKAARAFEELTSPSLSNWSESGDPKAATPDPGAHCEITVIQKMHLIDAADGEYYWTIDLDGSGTGGGWGGPPLRVPDKELEGTLCELHAQTQMKLFFAYGDRVRNFELHLPERPAAVSGVLYGKLPADIAKIVKASYDWIPKMTKSGKEIPWRGGGGKG